jgi:hypothetical protein
MACVRTHLSLRSLLPRVNMEELQSTSVRLFLPMLRLWLACDTFPPRVRPRLECLTTPAIALIELARQDVRGVGLLDPSAWIIMRKPVTDMA